MKRFSVLSVVLLFLILLTLLISGCKTEYPAGPPMEDLGKMLPLVKVQFNGKPLAPDIWEAVGVAPKNPVLNPNTGEWTYNPLNVELVRMKFSCDEDGVISITPTRPIVSGEINFTKDYSEFPEVSMEPFLEVFPKGIKITLSTIDGTSNAWKLKFMSEAYVLEPGDMEKLMTAPPRDWKVFSNSGYAIKNNGQPETEAYASPLLLKGEQRKLPTTTWGAIKW